MYVVALVCAVLAGGCFLLAAFGLETQFGVALVPLGLLFVAAAIAAHWKARHG